MNDLSHIRHDKILRTEFWIVSLGVKKCVAVFELRNNRIVVTAKDTAFSADRFFDEIKNNPNHRTDPIAEPEKFIMMLPYMYRGAYAWFTKVKEIHDESGLTLLDP